MEFFPVGRVIKFNIIIQPRQWHAVDVCLGTIAQEGKQEMSFFVFIQLGIGRHEIIRKICSKQVDVIGTVWQHVSVPIFGVFNNRCEGCPMGNHILDDFR